MKCLLALGPLLFSLFVSIASVAGCSSDGEVPAATCNGTSCSCEAGQACTTDGSSCDSKIKKQLLKKLNFQYFFHIVLKILDDYIHIQT